MEITIEKGDGSTFSAAAGGDQRKSATIQVSELNLILYMRLLLPFTPQLLELLFHEMLAFAYIVDSDRYRWIFSTSNSREFCKTGKVVYSDFNL